MIKLKGGRTKVTLGCNITGFPPAQLFFWNKVDPTTNYLEVVSSELVSVSTNITTNGIYPQSDISEVTITVTEVQTVEYRYSVYIHSLILCLVLMVDFFDYYLQFYSAYIHI